MCAVGGVGAASLVKDWLEDVDNTYLKAAIAMAGAIGELKCAGQLQDLLPATQTTTDFTLPTYLPPLNTGTLPGLPGSDSNS